MQKGRPFKPEVTTKKKDIFVEQMINRQNGATFTRKINQITIHVKFNVYVSTKERSKPVYTLRYYNDDNCTNEIIIYRVARNDNLHTLVKDFKEIV